MLRKIALTLLGVSLALIISSCQNSVNSVENSEKQAQPNFVKNKRVVTDGVLDDRISILRVDSKEMDSGLLAVQVKLRSQRVGFWSWLIKGDAPYKIAYRFHWQDESGMDITTAASTWIEKDILPGDTVTLTTIAPNVRCKDFLLKLRQLD